MVLEPACPHPAVAASLFPATAQVVPTTSAVSLRLARPLLAPESARIPATAALAAPSLPVHALAIAPLRYV
jgi:hypothetical protein